MSTLRLTEIEDLETGQGITVQELLAKQTETITPLQFGAVGDGLTNDGPALNSAINYLRSKLVDTNVTIKLDLLGKTYATDISINATGLISWGWQIHNGTILGRCTGKAVFDMVGSRGGHISNLVIDGHKVNRPSVGIQAARSGTGQFAFCDNMLWDNITTEGYFSLSGVHIYGQETTTYQHCRFWNYNSLGYSAIHTGYSAFAMASDYMTPMTGPTSYINNKYINCDYRFLPVDDLFNITGISKSNPAVVTSPGHQFVNGQSVSFGQINGMTQINNLTGVVSGVTANTFEVSIDSTAFSTYTSGGFAVTKQLAPTVYFARGEQHHFDTCYIVNYGSHSIQYDFIDTGHVPKSNWFDCLFEGAGSISHIEFTNVPGGTKVLQDFRLDTYNTHAREYIIGHTGGGSDIVSIYGSKITSQSRSVGSSATLLDAYSKFAFYNADVSTENTGQFDPASMGDRFVGSASWLDGKTHNYNMQYKSFRDESYVPVVSASSGTITAYTATGALKYEGDMAYVQITVNITNNGTGAGSLQVSFPGVAVGDSFLIGRNINTGLSVNGVISNGGSTISVINHAAAYPVGASGIVEFSGWVRTNNFV